MTPSGPTEQLPDVAERIYKRLMCSSWSWEGREKLLAAIRNEIRKEEEGSHLASVFVAPKGERE